MGGRPKVWVNIPFLPWIRHGFGFKVCLSNRFMGPQLVYTRDLGIYIDTHNHRGPKCCSLQQLKQNARSLNKQMLFRTEYGEQGIFDYQISCSSRFCDGQTFIEKCPSNFGSRAFQQKWQQTWRKQTTTNANKSGCRGQVDGLLTVPSKCLQH